MKTFTERPLLFLLAAVQFTHVTDFMILMPLGPQLMRELHITPAQFSSLVAAYTICAGVVGLCMAPFIDRFDRRRLLLRTYLGFIAGTIVCGLSHNFTMFLAARAICGAFGGVSTSLVMAIVSDVVPQARRASGMAVVMTAFAAASALGVPFSLFLAQHFRWEMPFFLLAGIAAGIWWLIKLKMPPVAGHLDHVGVGVLKDFWELLRDRNAGRGLTFMAMLVFGHFAVIPFFSPYLVANVGLPENRLFLVYLVGGVLTVFTAPTVGRLADRYGRQRIFSVLVVVASVVTLTITHLGPQPLWLTLMLTGAFFVFASGRFGPGQAIMSLAVLPRQRGAFMSLSACTRDLTCGVTSALAGSVVSQSPTGQLVHYNRLGWVAVGASFLALWLAHRVKARETAPAPVKDWTTANDQPEPTY